VNFTYDAESFPFTYRAERLILKFYRKPLPGAKRTKEKERLPQVK